MKNPENSQPQLFPDQAPEHDINIIPGMTSDEIDKQREVYRINIAGIDFVNAAVQEAIDKRDTAKIPEPENGGKVAPVIGMPDSFKQQMNDLRKNRQMTAPSIRQQVIDARRKKYEY